MIELTPKQREYLFFIKKFMADNGYAPTITETANHFGVNVNAAAANLKSLRRKKYITWQPRIARTIILVGGV